jgi:WhiB family transcriptional regulator, redox-sensing transcriptional regulator
MPFEACSSRAGRDECSDVGDLIELVGWRPAWHADAACREAPDGVSWFPTDGQAATTARAVCARCLAKEDCASWALEQGPDLKGIWAGRSERQRRRDKRAGVAARGAPTPTESAGSDKQGDEADAPRSETLDSQAIAGRLGVHAPVVARELALLPARKITKHPGLADPAADDLAVLLDDANRWLAG